MNEQAGLVFRPVCGRYRGISHPAWNLARIQEIKGRGSALHEARRIAACNGAIFRSASAFLFNKLHTEIYRVYGATD